MKNKKFIPIIAATAVIILIAVSALIIFNRTVPITDEKAQTILADLLPKADEINDIVWGAGLPIEPGQSEALNTITAAQYRKVAEDCPYQSTEDLKKAIAEVYSDDFIAKTINYTAFEGADDALEDTEAQMYPRYLDDDGILWVDITNKGFELTTEIDASSAKVVHEKRKKHTVEVKATVAGEETTLSLTLVEQENGWRLDTPTY